MGLKSGWTFYMSPAQNVGGYVHPAPPNCTPACIGWLHCNLSGSCNANPQGRCRLSNPLPRWRTVPNFQTLNRYDSAVNCLISLKFGDHVILHHKRSRLKGQLGQGYIVTYSISCKNINERISWPSPNLIKIRPMPVRKATCSRLLDQIDRKENMTYFQWVGPTVKKGAENIV